MKIRKILQVCLCTFLFIGTTHAMELSDADWVDLEAGQVVIQTQKVDGRRRVEAAILIHQNLSDIWNVMLDCPNAPEFVPSMRRCEIIERSDDGLWEIIEHEVKYGWIAPKTVYQFKAEYVPQEAIHFERISGDLKHLVGDWKLDTIENQDGSVLVSYSVYIDPGFIVPGFIARRALRKDLPEVMQALQQRVADVYGNPDVILP